MRKTVAVLNISHFLKDKNILTILIMVHFDLFRTGAHTHSHTRAIHVHTSVFIIYLMKRLVVV